MPVRRFTDPSQPQTLQIAVFLLYINAVFSLFGLNDRSGIYAITTTSLIRSISFDLANNIGQLLGLATIVASLAGGYLIANEKKLGYRLGIAATALPLVCYVVLLTIGYPHRYSLFELSLINVAFAVARFALLYHPESRNYQRLWFK